MKTFIQILLVFISCATFKVNAQIQHVSPQGKIKKVTKAPSSSYQKKIYTRWSPKKSKWAPTAKWTSKTKWNNPNVIYKTIQQPVNAAPKTSYVENVVADAENIFPAKGNAGIGTLQPMAGIEIKRSGGNGNNKNFMLSLSNVWAESGLNEPTIIFNNGDVGEKFSYWTLGARISGDNAHQDPQIFKIGYKAPNETDEHQYFSIDSYKGRVQIGYCNSNVDGYKLFVEDGILTEKVKVAVKNSEDWFDNVFEPGYKIMPLKNLENYLQQNKHLPEIPTTLDVMNNGLDLGKMNGLLLKKVEELTLYVIDLKNELDLTKKEIQEFKKH